MKFDNHPSLVRRSGRLAPGLLAVVVEHHRPRVRRRHQAVLAGPALLQARVRGLGLLQGSGLPLDSLAHVQNLERWDWSGGPGHTMLARAASGSGRARVDQNLVHGIPVSPASWRVSLTFKCQC
jgi:hypothetical protein